ncbi:MAG TPA: Ig-like domain-containing protein [bacterium]|nr:Ig-like domain-containing protein [bacterium]HPN42370.1 Ig-like domain-containing protein [bacterium]
MYTINKKYVMLCMLIFISAFSCGVVEKLNNREPVIKELKADRQTVMVGDTVTVNVVATDPDNDELTYSWDADGGIFINRDQSSVQWIAPTRQDDFSIDVTVRDENGGEAHDNITITVLADTRPDVRITNPADGQYIPALNNVEITVAAEPVAYIDKVEFYINGQLLGTDSTPPAFTCTWPLTHYSGNVGITAIAYRSQPRPSQASDSLTVSIQGVVPIP